MDFTRFSHLTFDCYGTLIDWETGILGALIPVLKQHGVDTGEADILRLYARFEAEQETGAYKPYKKVLEGVLEGIGGELGFKPTEEELSKFSSSVGSWPPFPDTIEALKWLQQRYRLVIVSNVDDDLFAQTQELLGIKFDEIITAQQVGAYKPSKSMFETALQRLNVPRERILHVAQSLYHDHAPAIEMGFSTVWVNRASILPGTGLTIPTNASPSLKVDSLASLCSQIYKEHNKLHRKYRVSKTVRFMVAAVLFSFVTYSIEKVLSVYGWNWSLTWLASIALSLSLLAIAWALMEMFLPSAQIK